jgi:NADPH2:quinone reductase
LLAARETRLQEESMQAVIVAEPGGPEVLQVQECPSPEPGPGQLRVAVAAAGVNFIDIYQRSGLYQMPTPFIAGSEGAGEVTAVGAGVTDTAVGDHVAWAMERGGGYATEVVVPAERTVPVPGSVSDETAAALMLQGLTAHYLCESTYPVQAGDDVLLHAGAGGVGLLLTQLITSKGGRVLATTSTSAKADLARGAGAAEVIRYTDTDVAAEVRRLTDGTGVAVVYDGVGRSTFQASLDSLRPRGMLVLFGGSSGPVEPVDPQTLNQKGSLYLTRPSLPHYIATREELLARAAALFEAVAAGRLDVRVGARYSLADAGRAHEDLAERRTTGKSLIIPR